MECIKFTLSGETAFFKKPDVNSYYYFTYGNIHKVALLGMLGAIVGFSGYNMQGNKEYPEFYEELKDIKISIVPKNAKGIIPKKIQIFNNSVGYASKEAGGNLIIKEQWLEKPCWDIYILSEGNDYYKEILDRLINNRYSYIPYLGKNDHFANIYNVEVIKKIEFINTSRRIDSLFLKDYFDVISKDWDDFDNDDLEDEWKYEEILPIELEQIANQYVTSKFVFTNMNVKAKKENKLLQCNGKVIFFF